MNDSSMGLQLLNLKQFFLNIDDTLKYQSWNEISRDTGKGLRQRAKDQGCYTG